MQCNILLSLQRMELVGRGEEILIRFANKDVIAGVCDGRFIVLFAFFCFCSSQVVGGEPSNPQLRYKLTCDQLKTRSQKQPTDGLADVTQIGRRMWEESLLFVCAVHYNQSHSCCRE